MLLLERSWFVGFCFTVVSESFCFMNTKNDSNEQQASSRSQVNTPTRASLDLAKKLKRIRFAWKASMILRINRRRRGIFAHMRVSGRQLVQEKQQEEEAEREEIKLLNVCRRILICLLSSPFFSLSHFQHPLVFALLSNNRSIVVQHLKGCGEFSRSSSWFRQ